MSLLGPKDEDARGDDALVDQYVAHHFMGVGPPEAPAPRASQSGQREPSEDELMAEYLRTYFPGRT